MHCQNCSRLNFLFTTKKCHKCSSEVHENLSVICTSCSEKDKICSVCLAKIIQVRSKRCSACGK